MLIYNMDEAYIRRCFELARLGLGRVSPNPLVGAVVVKEGQVVAEGFHAFHGAPHAEPSAFAKTSDKVLEGATLYVNLEPCCHTKKLTPPCVPLILQKKIARVVISNLDPNPAVKGQGVRELQAAGVAVTTGVLETEGAELNEIFFHRMQTGRPFIHLKASATLDGKIALPDGTSKWITSPEARLDSHHGRLSADAIVVGAETLRRDDPSLTVRVPSLKVERAPYRIVITESGKLPAQAQLFSDALAERSLIVTGPDTVIDVLPASQVIRLSTLAPFPFLELYSALVLRGIHSLWLEGGPRLQSLFLEHGQVQRVTLYLAPTLMGQGLSLFSHHTLGLSHMPTLTSPTVSPVGRDFKITGKIA